MTLEGVKSSTIKFNVLCVFEFHPLKICWLSVLVLPWIEFICLVDACKRRGVTRTCADSHKPGLAAILISAVFNKASRMHIASVNQYHLDLAGF